ncbi:MAG TPA: hypothetical protein VMU54_19425 [Planctomycetota bacterium]|nr:hypothetical protein [Planctomycetota bacterium]
MKSAVVALILGFGTVQTVSFVQCCCGPLCSTPGELCKNHDHQARGEKSCTSCQSQEDEHTDKCDTQSGKEVPGKTSRCTHVAPSSDLDRVQADPLVGASLEVAMVPAPLAVQIADPSLIALAEVVPRAGPEPRPLYLLHSALLI